MGKVLDLENALPAIKTWATGLFSTKGDTVKNITRSGTTFTATRADNTTFTFTQQDNTVAKTTTTPLMDGTAAIGNETKYAAGNHVHPTDTSRAPVDSPSFTGTPTTVDPPSDPTPDNAIPNAKWVRNYVDSMIINGAPMTTVHSLDISSATKEGFLSTFSLAGLQPYSGAYNRSDDGTGWDITEPFYLVVTFASNNTYQGALKFRVTSNYINATNQNRPYYWTKYKPIWINGAVSSESNYTLPAGIYLVYYDGSVFHFRTDEKLAGIANEAYKATRDGSGNIITSTYAKLASPTLTGTPKAPTPADTTNSTQIATTAFVQSVVSSKVSGLLNYKGSVTNYSDLPSTGNVKGDVWNVANAHDSYPAGTNYAWDGTAWDPLGGAFSIDYATATEVTTVLES